LQVATFTKATVYVHTKSPVCYTHVHLSHRKPRNWRSILHFLLKPHTAPDSIVYGNV